MLNLNEVIEKVKNNINQRDIKTTGLQGEENEIINLLYSNHLINHDYKNYIMVYGKNASGTNKVSQAKYEKQTTYTVEEFKEKILYNHPNGNLMENKTILIDSDLPQDVFAIAFTNPEKIIFSSQLNKRNVEDIDVIITNKKNIEKIKPGLESALSEKHYEHLIYDYETNSISQAQEKTKRFKA